MAGGPNYRQFKSFLADVSAKESRLKRERIVVKEGKGRYPSCLKSLPYDFCPKPEEVPKDPAEVHRSCRFCDEFKKSRFYDENIAEKERLEKIRRLKEAGLPTKLEF